MSFVPLEGEDASWTQPPKEPGDIVKDTIKKEQMIRCVALPPDRWLAVKVHPHSQGHNIRTRGPPRPVTHGTTPEGCAYSHPTALLARVKVVQADVDKLTPGNETLQMYVDNLKLQVAKQR